MSLINRVIFVACVLFTFVSGKQCSYPYRTLGSNCYYFSTDKASWDEAYVNCFHKGGYLANLETLHEYLIMRYKLAGMKNGNICIKHTYKVK
ncbi:type-2 ice-structuring protein-like [Saccostrea cucullata]|uniref:type-2 ice-structuring protein-like n=1 Tax=Saccostrea cuccullata TaxID=36930 RepID=UPI002ED650D8